VAGQFEDISCDEHGRGDDERKVAEVFCASDEEGLGVMDLHCVTVEEINYHGRIRCWKFTCLRCGGEGYQALGRTFTDVVNLFRANRCSVQRMRQALR
jgi:hypothetical protein